MEEPGAQQTGPDGPLEALPGASSAPSDSGGDGMVSAETITPLTCDAAVQTAAPAPDAAAAAAQLRAPALAAFLHRAVPRCEEALQQNELADPLLDALAALVDEEAGDGGAADRPGTSMHAGMASSAAGLVEHHSFSDLLHSKGRPLAAACFHPGRRGVVAVAVGGASGSGTYPSAQPAACGLPGGVAPHQAQPGCILVWNHSDAIHPEAVLRVPAEVTALAWHPTQQHCLAAGLATGQVALFHVQQQAGSIGSGTAAAAPSGRTAAGGQAIEGGQEGSSHAAELLPLHLSMPEASHQAAVADLHWLPGVALSRDGHLEAVAPHSVGGGAALPTGPADGCTLFATTAADGALLCWDMRISARHRKQAAKEEEQLDWKPALALAAAGAAKQPLLASRFYADTCGGATAAAGRFVVGDLAGELAVVDAASYSIERRRKGSSTGASCGGAEGAGSGAKGGLGEGSSASGGQGSDALVPIFESRLPDALYSCGCWSPSKPGVVILGRQDGRLEAWDLLDRTHQPCMVAPVAPCALTTLAVSPLPSSGVSSRAAASAPQVLAVGDVAGTLRLLELPRALRRRGHAETKAVASLLAREQARVALVSAHLERLAVQQRAAQAAAQAAARKAQQEAAAGSQDAAQDDAAEAAAAAAAAEQRYAALEVEWRARLLGPAADAVAAGGDAAA
ncbi:flagellar inner dynein arm I1 intermediate chain IC140 [Chlorella sorokiniana]|uniref:Flagellar inner dynein arm I1 intermediate chain IC140 n=1 Tax=Chlorella sorokiniana TaxID=3076 RepID=A0A2P6TX28_CHLSO|nr:flagellar inner dynein arm I1 intermediate chain IC140 [Chlorella sorokiniana]|eukprot:PRW58624.1 flagellar inner dynein arm I1 intermediate chain IC140 [Chlorella sorokiniana]